MRRGFTCRCGNSIEVIGTPREVGAALRRVDWAWDGITATCRNMHGPQRSPARRRNPRPRRRPDMKLKDIKVGEDYAVGSHNYPARARVVEVGDITHKERRWSRSGLTKTTKGAIRVMKQGGVGEYEDIVRPAQVLRPWAEQEAVDAERARQTALSRGREQARAAERNALIAQFKAATGVDVAWRDGSYRIDEAGLNAILDLLDDTTSTA